LVELFSLKLQLTRTVLAKILAKTVRNFSRKMHFMLFSSNSVIINP